MKALQLKQQLLADHFGDYPPILLEWEVTKGRDDIQTGGLTKRLGKLAKPFSETWTHHLKLLDAMRDLRYLNNTVFNRQGLESMIEQYALFDIRLKALQKVVKQQKNFPEVGEYYQQRFDYLMEINVFDLMHEDCMALKEVANQRYQAYINQYPGQDIVLMESTVDEAEIGAIYKASLKKAKASA